MAYTLFSPINDLIHNTASSIVGLDVTTKVADALKSIVDAGAQIAQSSLEGIQTMTDLAASPAPATPPSSPSTPTP